MNTVHQEIQFENMINIQSFPAQFSLRPLCQVKILVKEGSSSTALRYLMTRTLAPSRTRMTDQSWRAIIALTTSNPLTLAFDSDLQSTSEVPEV